MFSGGLSVPDWALRYENGSEVELTSRSTFNFANASMAAEFGATCARAIGSGSADVCFYIQMKLLQYKMKILP